MNPELHHRWNAERDTTRGSAVELKEILQEQKQQNKVTLKQNKPR
jgi:dihydrodipicolinate reductase